MATNKECYLTDEETDYIAKNIGDNWHQLGKAFNVGETNLTDIAQSNMPLIDKVHKIISLWKHQDGLKALKDVMVQVLLNIERKDIADWLMDRNKIGKKDECEENFDNFRNCMKSLYEDLPIPQISIDNYGDEGDPLVDDVYIHQEMVMCKDSSTFKGTMKENASIELHQLFDSVRETAVTRILIEGDPGFGKTTLTYKLASDWAHEENYISSRFQLVLLIPLKELQSELLDDVLQDIWNKATRKQLGKEALLAFFNREDVLFILDGVDELNIQGRNNLHAIFFKEKFSLACFVLTSRRGVFAVKNPGKITISELLLRQKNINNHKFWDKRILLKGISNSQRKLFYEKHFQNYELLSRKVDGLFNEHMEGMLRCPLIVLWLGRILQNNRVENIQTKTTLYKLFLNLVINKYIAKKSVNHNLDFFDPENINNSICTEVRADISQMGEFLLSRLLNQNLIFEENEMKHMTKNVLLKSDIFINFKSLTMKDEIVSLMQPLHRSLVEFLAAYALCNIKETSSFSFRQKIKEMIEGGLYPSNDTLFYQFLAGLMDIEVHVLFHELSPWSSIYHLCKPAMINVLAEISHLSLNVNLINSILQFFPLYYQITETSTNFRSFFNSAHHTKLFELCLNRKKYDVVKWDLDSWPLHHFNSTSDIKVDKLILNPSASDNASNLPFYASIQCREFICQIDVSIVNWDSWNSFLLVFLAIQAESYSVYLTESDTESCSLILNEIQDGQLKNINFQRIRLSGCALTDEHIKILIALVTAGRITQGLSLQILSDIEICTDLFCILWDSVLESSKIAEFEFSNCNVQLLPEFSCHKLCNREASFEYLGFEGYFLLRDIKLEQNRNLIIEELYLRSFSDSSHGLELMKSYKSVGCLQCTSKLLICLTEPVSTVVQEIYLMIESGFHFPLAVFANDRMPKFRALVIDFQLLGDEAAKLDKLHTPMEHFLSSVLKHCKLELLGLYHMKSASEIEALTKALTMNEQENLNFLELVFCNELPLKEVLNAMKPMARLMVENRIMEIHIIDYYSSNFIFDYLPSLFPEDQFQFECEIDRLKTHSLTYQQQIYRLMGICQTLIIKLKNNEE